MTTGPGKYDDLCTLVREKAGLEPGKPGGVVVIVFGGNKGTGFSVQADLITTVILPQVLVEIANQIRNDISQPES